MLAIPFPLQARFKEALQSKPIPDHLQGFYKKWLQYYLDFCAKYGFSPGNKENLSHFIAKLRQKKQAKGEQEQALKAIGLYYEIVGSASKNETVQKNTIPHCRTSHINPKRHPIGVVTENPVQNVKGVASVSHGAIPSSSVQKAHVASEPIGGSNSKRETGVSWKAQFSLLEEEIRLRHYSVNTLRTYKVWASKFQTFTHSKNPELLSADEVKEFLTFLAVKRKVSATTQNQAFNALLFFYRHALNREFGKIDGVVRAKRKPYIPVVLSREEINSILKYIEPPYALVVNLLYGCGLRLFECLELRVHCINFDAGVLTVHDGKGKKDRTVPLPEAILQELREHLESLKKLHQRDLKLKYAGVFLVNALEEKYKNASKEFPWQWFFPARQLTFVKETKEYRRYHLHKTHVQKAISQAVRKAQIPKRASAHTFRHSFASHLLQANYDIRTIQELLGHSDVRTTMIYTHTVKSRTLKEAKSPLDF